ncbi:MAG: hypothetical protein GY841_10265 [FCB group bacterium]|nr:hypothetical protein [FCB group bacterium]
MLTKKQALSWLKSGRTLIGQQLGNKPGRCIETYDHFIGDLFDATGKHPAILGVSYWGGSVEEYKRMNAMIREHCEQGGIFTAYIPMNNPWTGEDHHDITRTRLLDLITPGSDVYDTWRYNLDLMVTRLSEIGDCPGIWRPFHECTYARGAWWTPQNWWGADYLREQDVSDFKAVWQHWHRYFDEAGLDNLIWALSTANRAAPSASALDMYAGPEYVDLCGPSLYWGETLVDNYNPPAPFVICETGNDSGAPVSLPHYYAPLLDLGGGYMLVWASWPRAEGEHVAIVDNFDRTAFMNLPQLVTREELNAPTVEPVKLRIAGKFDELAELFREWETTGG